MPEKLKEELRAKVRAEGPGGVNYDAVCRIPKEQRHPSMQDLPYIVRGQ